MWLPYPAQWSVSSSRGISWGLVRNAGLRSGGAGICMGHTGVSAAVRSPRGAVLLAGHTKEAARPRKMATVHCAGWRAVEKAGALMRKGGWGTHSSCWGSRLCCGTCGVVHQGDWPHHQSPCKPTHGGESEGLTPYSPHPNPCCYCTFPSLLTLTPTEPRGWVSP